MIALQEVIDIHHALIQHFGGMQGIRDEGLLLSAIDRPFSGFGIMAFYPSAEEKASAIIESIVKNHPFFDGNKRTGYVLMRLVLMSYGKDVEANQDKKFAFVMDIAAGKMDFDAILAWIRQHLKTSDTE